MLFQWVVLLGMLQGKIWCIYNKKHSFKQFSNRLYNLPKLETEYFSEHIRHFVVKFRKNLRNCRNYWPPVYLLAVVFIQSIGVLHESSIIFRKDFFVRSDEIPSWTFLMHVLLTCCTRILCKILLFSSKKKLFLKGFLSVLHLFKFFNTFWSM